MHHILSVEQFDTEALEDLFDEADTMRELDADPLDRRSLAMTYIGRQLCSLFYEPSTRTRLSFEQAAAKLGMGVVSTENAALFSSAAKGETIEDTTRVLNEYHFDAVVIRHKEEGHVGRAAAVSSASIINAGDGKGEHPTQSLLDTYTIHQHHQTLGGLNIVVGGDLANGRTARSLVKLLAKFPNNRFSFVTIPELAMGDDIKSQLESQGTPYEETTEMHDALSTADVVYWTRLQLERIDASEEEKDRLRNGFVLDQSAFDVMPDSAAVLHPLPRVDEISTEVDNDPRAIYFRQAGNGLYIRMALIDDLLKAKDNETTPVLVGRR